MSALYGTERSVTLFTGAWVQSTTHPVSLRSILFSLCYLLFGFPDFHYAFHIHPVRALSPWFYHCNNIWWRVCLQIIKCLIMQMSRYSCYSFLHTPVTPLSAPFSVLYDRPSIQETGFHSHTRQLIFTVYIFIFTWYIAIHNNLFDIGCLTHTACWLIRAWS